uniref:Uncharacterized protein n=1 Tax=Anguilla anguilla TaxID=7936 RepID=A0A0E9UZV2_ANGAN
MLYQSPSDCMAPELVTKQRECQASVRSLNANSLKWFFCAFF